MHLAWTQVLWSSFVQGRRMDPRILFVRNSGRGPAAKTPSILALDRRAFLAPGKGWSVRTRARGTNLFLYLRSWPIIFLRTLFPALRPLPRSQGSFLPPFYSRSTGARNCRLSLSLSPRRVSPSRPPFPPLPVAARKDRPGSPPIAIVSAYITHAFFHSHTEETDAPP